MPKSDVITTTTTRSYLRSDHSGGGDCKGHFYIRLQSHGILKKWSWKVMEKSWNFICRYPWGPYVNQGVANECMNE